MTTTEAQGAGGLDLGGSAPVLVRYGGQVDSDIVIEWDFDNDGDFDGPHEDITGYVMAAETLAGRDFPSSLTGQTGPGQLKLTLLNTDDRFSYFNQASPLNQDGNSLRTGRRIRIRTAESTPDDPVLLVRDRFNRPDGDLASTETGQAWTLQAGTWQVAGGVARAVGPHNTRVLATVDCGSVSHYVQATIRQLPTHPFRFVGIIVGWLNASNYSFVVYDADSGIDIYDVDGGSSSVVAHYDLWGWEGMTIGASRSGSTVTAYVGGAPVASAVLPGPVNGTEVGLFANYDEHSGRAPEVGDFHVWDHMAAPVDGILWTGNILDVSPSVEIGSAKVAEVTAEGVLARAARAVIASPRLARAGAATGLVVGDVLARAGLAHPPAELDPGTVTTGPIGIDDGDALTMARMLEETERGFLHETNEGQVGYHDAAHVTEASQAWFSDTPGVGQFRYRSIVPVDHKGQVINEVAAGVAPEAPAGITSTFPSGVSHVDITIPTVNDGDLLLVFIASTVDDGHDWLSPIFWVNHRDLKAAPGLRIYSRICNGTEGGTVQRFYSNTGGSGGLWMANVIRIESWFGAYPGIEVGEPVPGNNAGPVVHQWGRDPTMFLVVLAGIGGTGSGMTFSTGNNPPDGYGSAAGNIITSGVPATEAGIMSGWKIDCTDSEDPTAWPGLSNVDLAESVVVAIRGYNGPHTKPTLQDPRVTGGKGRTVTVADVGSQDEHNAILTHKAASVLFATEDDAQAYGEAVLAAHADDRPIVTLTFPAHLSASHRAQAIRRRVGDKITIVASGATGLGVEGDFIIEAIGHRWTHAGKQWECTWQVSPA